MPVVSISSTVSMKYIMALQLSIMIKPNIIIIFIFLLTIHHTPPKIFLV